MFIDEDWYLCVKTLGFETINYKNVTIKRYKVNKYWLFEEEKDLINNL